MPRSSLRYKFLLLALLFAESVAADPFTGDFYGLLDGKEYRLSISGYAGRRYEGVFSIDDENLQLNARRFGDRLAGQIGLDHFKFGFLLQSQNGGLLLRDQGGKAIFFRRIKTD